METEDFKGFDLLNTSPTDFTGEIKEVSEIPGALGEVTNDDDGKTPTDKVDPASGVKDNRTNKDADSLKIQTIESMEDVDDEEEEKEDGGQDDGGAEEDDAFEDTNTDANVEDDEEEETIFKTLANEFSDKGLLAELGEDFEDSEEGFAALIDKTVSDKVKEYKDGLPEVAKNYLNYLEAGGDPQHYVDSTTSIDYNRINVDKLSENEAAQKEIVYNLLVKEGYEPDEISEEIEDYIDGGLLANKAKRALSKLQKFQAQDQANMLEEQQKQAEEFRQQQEQFYTDLKNDIDTRDEIAGFNLNSKKQRSAFYDYITKVDRKTGKTQLQMDSEADAEAQLKTAWFYFNKFDFSKVEKKAKTKATSDLKAKLEKHSDSTSKLKSKRRTSSPDDAIDGDFGNFKRIL
jgi:hypothetical protein